jgi:hypothetical protein
VAHGTLGEAEFGKMAAIVNSLHEAGKQAVALSDIIEKSEDGGMPREKAETILRAMHKLGSVFYFSKNPELREVVFLNPKQIVGQIEQALDLKKLRETRETVVERIEKLHSLLAPLHEKYEDIGRRSTRVVNVLAHGLLLALCAQFALFARLTWWDSSWDVMEPVTWITTSVETIIMGYGYFLFARSEYSNQTFKSWLVGRRIRRLARKSGFDVKQYQALQAELKSTEALLEHYPSHD